MLNSKTGRFNLTAPRIQRWWHQEGEAPTLESAARLLQQNGIKVFAVEERVDCEYSPEKIWEILSGRPSDSKAAKRYWDKLARWQRRHDLPVSLQT